MATRYVERTGKGDNGDITKLCGEGVWSPRSKSEAISDIENGVHSYAVSWPEKKTDIHVVNGEHGKYLRTDRDETTKNNLDDLPDC